MKDFFTVEQVKELNKPLRGEYVSERDGLSYLEGWHVINEANRIFGFGNWSGELVELRHLGDTEEPGRNGAKRYKTAYLARYRVTVRGANGDTAVYEDVGFGSATNYSSPIDNHENAAKEAVTDAMKRCFRNLGNQFGNALYDKQQRNVKHAVTVADITNAIKNLEGEAKAQATERVKEMLTERGFEKLSEADQDTLEAIAEYLKVG